MAENEVAAAAAEYVYQCLFPRHRGVLDCGDKIVVFGNDGYRTEDGEASRALHEIELLKQYLKKEGLWDESRPHRSPQFGLSKNGYSWAVVIFNYQRRYIDLKELEDTLMACWDSACKKERLAAVEA